MRRIGVLGRMQSSNPGISCIHMVISPIAQHGKLPKEPAMEAGMAILVLLLGVIWQQGAHGCMTCSM